MGRIDAEVNEVLPSIFHLDFGTRYHLVHTMMRFQEHYESPRFRGKVFTHEEFMDWYAKERGGFTYEKDWSGFNIPSRVLKPFYEGRFDPLTKKESALLETFHGRPGDFYIIGTYKGSDSDVIDHEVAHGLFSTNPEYRREVKRVLRGVSLRPVERWLGKNGYHESVFLDEANSYLACDFRWLVGKDAAIARLAPQHKSLRKLFREYARK